MIRFAVPLEPCLDDGRITLLLNLGDQPDPAFLVDCIQTFEDEFALRQPRLDQAASTGDREALRQQVHFLAGSGANLGLALLARLCRHYEQALLEHESVDPAEVASSVQAAVALSLDTLKKRLKT